MTATPDRILRECDCSERPVDRCVHFMDESIYLDDWSYEVAEIGRLLGPRYDVWATFRYEILYHGDDYDAALTAFHEAEEALLRGEL